MEDGLLSSLSSSLVPIVFIGFILFSIISFARKYNKIKKLKSGEVPSRTIKWIVSEIKYHTSWKNGSWKINSRYFIAKWTNPINNEELEFESNIFPYKDAWFKIRRTWPNEEDEKKLLEYARTFIKEWDSVNIHISNEDENIYYIEDIVKINDTAFNDISQIPGDIIKLTQGLNIGWKEGNDFFSWIKNFKKSLFFIIIALGFWPLVFLFIGDASHSSNLQLPKINLWMNLNFGWSYIVRIIIALLIAFVIYKVIAGYRWSKK